jgi:hypothetical protein
MPPQWRRLDYVELDHLKGSSRGGLFSGSGLVDEFKPALHAIQPPTNVV